MQQKVTVPEIKQTLNYLIVRFLLLKLLTYLLNESLSGFDGTQLAFWVLHYIQFVTNNTGLFFFFLQLPKLLHDFSLNSDITHRGESSHFNSCFQTSWCDNTALELSSMASTTPAEETTGLVCSGLSVHQPVVHFTDTLPTDGLVSIAV